jgi:hypothetical protein
VALTPHATHARAQRKRARSARAPVAGDTALVSSGPFKDLDAEVRLLRGTPCAARRAPRQRRESVVTCCS